MATVMRVSDTSTIHRSMNALTAQLAGLSRGRPELSIANSLWGQSGLTFQQPFLDVLAREYGAGLELVDYESDPEAARRAIDEWVGEQTDGRIPELLPPGSLTPDTRLTLVNAVHLLAPWETPFDPDSTSEAGFTTADGRAVRVQMMHAGLEVGYASGDGWQAVELPYADSPLAMLVFLPEEGFLDLFEATFLVTDATPYLEVQRVVLQMPRFSIASSFSLADQLAASGMPSAFDPGVADFSGMTTETPLFIGAVEHQATITCTETGTEAAAATAVEAVAGAMPGEPVELTLDRPFVFALRDRESGTIVFLGRVGDPS
jgi:serpin B